MFGIKWPRDFKEQERLNPFLGVNNFQAKNTAHFSGRLNLWPRDNLISK